MEGNKIDAYDIIYNASRKIVFITDIALAMGFSMQRGGPEFAQNTMEGLHLILRETGDDLQRAMELLEAEPVSQEKSTKKIKNG